MILLSIGMWCVLIFSLRVALFGNPLLNLLRQTDKASLENAEKSALSALDRMEEKAFHLVRRLSRLTILEAVMFLLELGILIFLVFTHTYFWVSVTLLFKDLIIILFSILITRRFRHREKKLSSLCDLPAWFDIVERVSASLSALGFFYLFLAVNQIFVTGATG